VFDYRSYPGVTNAASAYGVSPGELLARAGRWSPVSRAGELAKAGVPAFLIHGDVDTVVPLPANSGEFVRQYEQAGASSRVKLVVLPGQGHNMYEGFFRSQELVDFVIERARAGRE
jgi:pimeloyl-ACP methyl ester carboxylesterase